MWDTQVNLLRDAIDLRERVDQLAATPIPDQAAWLGALDALMKQSREVSAEAKTVDKSLKELHKAWLSWRIRIHCLAAPWITKWCRP